MKGYKQYFIYLFKFVFLALFVWVSPNFAQDKKSILEEQNLKSILLKEIATIKRLLPTSQDPKLHFRYFTARIELLKITKEEENRKFFQKISQNNKNNKNSSKKIEVDENYLKDKSRRAREIFPRAYQEYQALNTFAQNFELRFPAFIYQDEFNLLWGLMIYEYEEESPLVPIKLKKSAQVSKNNKLKLISFSTLADYYFNRNDVKNAISLYDFLVKNSDDPVWVAKYRYNKAWCAFKLENYDLALAELKFIIKRKNTKIYKSYYDQSIKFLPIFYIYGNKVDEGIEYVFSEFKEPIDLLVNFVDISIEKGEFQVTKNVKQKSESFLMGKKRYQELFDFQYRVLLKIVNQEGAIDYYELRRLVEGIHQRIEYGEKEKLKNLYVELENFLKRKNDFFMRNTFENSNKVSVEVTKTYILTLRFLSKHNPSKRKDYDAALMDVYLYQNDYNEAFLLGYSMMNFFKLKNLDQNFYKNMFGMLAKCKDAKIPKCQKLTMEKRHVFFQQYLEVFPSEIFALDALDELYQFHLTSQRYDQCMKLLKIYYAHQRTYLSQNPQLMTVILDELNKKEDFNQYRQFLNFAKQDGLKVNQDYLVRAEKNYIKMEFNYFNKKIISSPSQEVAQKLWGYLSNPILDREFKILGAQNVLVYLAKTKNDPEILIKIPQFIGFVSKDEFVKYRSTIIAPYENFLLKGDWDSSAALGDKLLEKTCSLADSYREIVFGQLNLIYVSQKNTDKLSELFKRAYACAIKPEVIAREFEFIYSRRDFLKEPDSYWLGFTNLHPRLTEIYQSYQQDIIRKTIYASLTSFPPVEGKKYFLKFNQKFESQTSYPVRELVTYQNEILDYWGDLKLNKIFMDLKFPEDEYMKIMNQNLNTLNGLQAKVQKMVEHPAYEIKIQAYFLQAEFYLNFLTKIRSFTAPKGTPEDAIKALADIENQFKGQMLPKVKEHKAKLQEIIVKRKIPSIINFVNNKYFSHPEISYAIIP